MQAFRGHGAVGRVLLALALAGTPLAAGADDFRFAFVKGDKFRVLSTVDESVYVNRRFSHQALIQNRIAFSVKDVKDGSGLLSGTFDTSTRFEGGVSFVKEKSYDSEYWCGPLGRYAIDARYFMPTVRHVPTFPGKGLSPGDTWNAPAEERQDFTEDFGIPDPYVIPVDVRYKYVGPATRAGRDVRVISASYTVFYQPPAPRAFDRRFPTQIAGYSEQTIYWDVGRSQPGAYEERFKFVFELSDGNVVEYRGSAEAEVVEAELMDREALAGEVRAAVKDLKDVSVSQNDKGVTITLENVQFEAESARLLPSEALKLGRIASVLSGVPDRDLLVAGHTALAGTPSGRAKLSVDRARAVADYLIKAGVRAPERVTVEGYGAERPVASNATEEGMARNRRVEITILEN